MQLFDYKQSSEIDRNKYMESFKITTGLTYFGGKSIIGKYLMNRIFNMAVKMDQDKNHADIFIDGFTGGGKIALSVPEGWFNTIVMNDYNYGVYSYFKCCKECPTALYKMIENLSKIVDETTFRYFTLNRSNFNGENSRDDIKREGKESELEDLISNKDMDPLVSGAMTFLVTKLSYSGTTDPVNSFYKASLGEDRSLSNEQEKIEKAVKAAAKTIPKVSKILNENDIIIEHLDYKELIKKYNGKPYKDRKNEEHEAIKEYADKNKLWYFDPPYHPATLAGGNNAPYEDTFTLSKSREMVKILHNDYIDEYGELKYFIKSDYSIRYVIKQSKEELEYLNKLKNKGTLSEKNKKTVNDRIKGIKKAIDGLHDDGNGGKFKPSDCINDFDRLEENMQYDDDNPNPYYNQSGDIEYYVECVGEFAKNGVDTDFETGESLGTNKKGREYIWCRGNYIPENS